MRDRCFIIAEAGVNHNGDERLALDLVETAASCGADAVKFQTFSADKLVRPGAEKAEYQKQATGNGDQYAMLKALEMSPELHQRLFERCKELDIEFMSTPFDEDAVEFLLHLGMERIKIPSGEITNEPFLTFLASKGKPLILSSGMATLDEILRAVDVIQCARNDFGLDTPLNQVLTILHCTSNYPAKCKDVNLRALQTIAEATGLPVGYSDHTLGIAVSTAAVAMGARIIEKHFTIDRKLPGPDHQASLDPKELAQLVRQIRDVEQALGSAIKQPTESELPVRDLVRRSVTLVRPLVAGGVVSREDMALLRPGTGIPPAELDATIGKTVTRDIPAGTTLQWSDLA
ncbi:N-acetylneuraminate synthase [Paucimonas lemoignei]|uniref:N-acetylneuraminate synthase n=1 Tax=Paucimonas lemoignei TaxID=29443 RepID=A0A4R3HTF9_PAULE|nr:N-acetylneuraminate synthase [Paucimonas lemoignei]TCS35099.1 N-acetylneuraminate synthase [Paucimonas lemoignei]